MEGGGEGGGRGERDTSGYKSFAIHAPDAQLVARLRKLRPKTYCSRILGMTQVLITQKQRFDANKEICSFHIEKVYTNSFGRTPTAGASSG